LTGGLSVEETAEVLTLSPVESQERVPELLRTVEDAGPDLTVLKEEAYAKLK
jgi:hypothetical protein